MEYKIFTFEDKGITLKEIEEKVNSLIQEGWVPLGSPFSPSNFESKNIMYAQAMIRENEFLFEQKTGGTTYGGQTKSR